MGSSTKSNLFCEIQPILYLGFASFDQIFQTLSFMGVLVLLFLGSRNGGSGGFIWKIKDLIVSYFADLHMVSQSL